MKIIVLLSLLVVSNFVSGQPKKVASKPTNVLFIGNSYIYFNDMPKMCVDVAASLGETIVKEQHTPGGFTLKQQSETAEALTKIKAGNWDYVILQEQSELPSFPIEEVKARSFPYARFLDSLIHQYSPKAKTIFYETWGRKKGDSVMCAKYPSICTYAGMDSLLAARYNMLAHDNHALLAPVGVVWKYLRTNHPNLELYVKDGSHPSPAGSYAAACTFVTVIYKKDPTLITFNSTLPAADADIIKAAVKKVVKNRP